MWLSDKAHPWRRVKYMFVLILTWIGQAQQRMTRNKEKALDWSRATSVTASPYPTPWCLFIWTEDAAFQSFVENDTRLLQSLFCNVNLSFLFCKELKKPSTSHDRPPFWFSPNDRVVVRDSFDHDHPDVRMMASTLPRYVPLCMLRNSDCNVRVCTCMQAQVEAYRKS